MNKIIKFSAPWCGPCKAIKPLWEKVKKENPSIQFEMVDIDEDEAAVITHQIGSIPTTIYIKNGVEVLRKVGVHALDKTIAEVYATP